MIKPDGVQRGLVGAIIQRFEAKGFFLRGLKMMSVEKAHAEKHYADLSSKPFFGDLVDYMCSGPVVCMVWEGKEVVKTGRKIIGATNPLCVPSSPPRERCRRRNPASPPPTLASASPPRARRLAADPDPPPPSSLPAAPPSPAPSAAITASSWAATSSTAPTPSSPRSTRSPSGSPRASPRTSAATRCGSTSKSMRSSPDARRPKPRRRHHRAAASTVINTERSVSHRISRLHHKPRLAHDPPPTAPPPPPSRTAVRRRRPA